MKKLMIALAATAFGVVANAASYGWYNMGPLVAYTQGDDVATGTIYLMDGGSEQGAANTAAAQFINTILAADDYQSAFNTAVGSAINSATLAADGTLSNAKTGTWNDGMGYLEMTGPGAGDEARYLYQVILDTANNGVFISEVYEIDPLDGTFANDLGFWNDGQETVFGSDVKSYTTSGWYTAAVPEPTSGLLLLLGMAGLALRRRRA